MPTTEQSTRRGRDAHNRPIRGSGVSRTIRVRPAAYERLAEEARERGESIPEVVDHLLRDLDRWKFVLAAQAGYARLQRDPDAWAAYRAEIAELDGTIADGLDAAP